MNSHFPGFYRPNDAFYDKLFKEAIIVLDTNILLDFYRVSPDTSKELIKIINKLGKRIWIPYQVAYEYHKDLFSVVEGQIKKYEEAATAIETISKTFIEKRSHPFLTNDLYEKASATFKELLQFYDNQRDELENIIMKKSLKDKICKLFEQNVGERFTSNELEEIYKEGDDRYLRQIPPGYMDKNKQGKEKYGDLIVWKEILKKSKKESKSILLVTDDTKDDWYIRFRGKKYGPNPQLIKEFQDYTGQQLYIYTLERFLENSNKLNIEVNSNILDELKARKENETNEANSGQINNYDNFQSELTNEMSSTLTLNEQIESQFIKSEAYNKGQVQMPKPFDDKEETNN